MKFLHMQLKGGVENKRNTQINIKFKINRTSFVKKRGGNYVMCFYKAYMKKNSQKCLL